MCRSRSEPRRDVAQDTRTSLPGDKLIRCAPMSATAWTHILRTRSNRLKLQSRRLVAKSRELVHDAGNLLLLGKLRRMRRQVIPGSPARRAA